MSENSEKPTKWRDHDFVGELYAGHLFVHELFGYSPHDHSRTWLVEDLKTGKAELWRTSDLSRIARRGLKSNKIKYGGYRWSDGPKNCRGYYLDLESAGIRLDEIRAAEPAHFCVVAIDTDEEGKVTERCGRAAPHRYFGTDPDGVRYEMWFCAAHLPFMAKIDWNKRRYY
ncbi:MAG: hypothetical protein WB616_14010 [Candidatus Sulfotelmatobacter sp.]